MELRLCLSETLLTATLSVIEDIKRYLADIW